MSENFKLPFRFKGAHHCQAVVLACIDFRFWKETMNFIEDFLGIESYDFPKLPGSAKAINESKDGDISMMCVGVPCDLHGVEKIVIVNHSDCGAYGGLKKFDGNQDEERIFHHQELRKAKGVISEKYPEKEILLVFAKLVNDQSEIEFEIVD
jgi:hypothetical protein